MLQTIPLLLPETKELPLQLLHSRLQLLLQELCELQQCEQERQQQEFHLLAQIRRYYHEAKVGHVELFAIPDAAGYFVVRIQTIFGCH